MVLKLPFRLGRGRSSEVYKQHELLTYGPELNHLPSEEFELTANSLGAHMKVIESSSNMGHGELNLRISV